MRKFLGILSILVLTSFMLANTPGHHTVSLSWVDAGTGITSYNVYRGAASGVCAGTPTPYVMGVTTTSFLDSTPLTGTNIYAVSAVGTGGESSCSSELQLSVPDITTQTPGSLSGKVN